MLDRLSNLKISALATCVPATAEANSDLAPVFGERDMQRFGKSTGILERRIARDCSALDLCIAAAERLRTEGHRLDDVRCVIFVSQTPEYVLPSSSAIAQARLNLPTDIAAFDVNLGCSGYIYGLLLAARMLGGVDQGKVLLLVGDTISRLCDPEDRATRPIFGDAGSATIIETSPDGSDWAFTTRTDGAGSDAIIVPGSGFARANPAHAEFPGGKLRMDGAAVFGFATTAVPQLITEALEALDLAPDDIEHLYLHQANDLILKTIARKTAISPDKTPSSLAKFGNTSCASIPMAITQDGDEHLGRSVLCGFGVGLSWAAMIGDLGRVPIYHGELAEA